MSHGPKVSVPSLFPIKVEKRGYRDRLEAPLAGPEDPTSPLLDDQSWRDLVTLHCPPLFLVGSSCRTAFVSLVLHSVSDIEANTKVGL